MATQQSNIEKRRTESISLANGGFARETEVMTTKGPVQVSELEVRHQVPALDLTTGVVKPKQLTSVEAVSSSDEIVILAGKRFDFAVAPEHPIPYCTKAIQTPRLTTANALEQQRYYKFVNQWRYASGAHVETVDVTTLTDEYQICVTPEQHGRSFRTALPDDCIPVQRNGYTGYTFDAATFERYREEICAEAVETSIRSGKGHRRQPYQFDGDDFIEFLGWFVTEGSVYWPQDRQTATVQIAQKTERHRRRIESLLRRMAFDPHQQENGFRFGSYLYGQLLTDLCGDDSHSKRLPDLVWLFSTEQKEHLLEILLFGDGNEYGTYYTASDRLAGDILQLCLEVGYKPRYVYRRGTWQIFVNEVNDGFDTDTHLSTELYDGLLYQLTVEDDPIVMAGRNGKFQWVGVSNVC